MPTAAERIPPRGRGLRISGKLFLIPSVGLVFLTLLGAVAYLGLSRQRAAVADLYQGRFRSHEHSARLVAELTGIQAGTYKLMSWTSAGFDQGRVDGLSRQLDQALTAAGESLESAQRRPGILDSERQLFRAAAAHLVEYRKAAHGVIELASVDIGMANTYMSIAEGKFELLESELKDLLALEDRLSRESYKESLEQFASSRLLFLALFAVGLVFSVLGSIFILQRMIISPIRLVEAAAQKVGDGDLSFDVPATRSDEIGRMIRLLRASFQALAGILRRIKTQSNRISSVVESVEQESKRVVAGAEVEAGAVASISESVRGLDATAAAIAESTRSLSASTGDTATAVEQLVASIQRIDGNAAKLSRGAGSTSTSIEELARSVNKVAASAQQLTAASEETLQAVSEINRTVQAVGSSAKESTVLSERVTTEAATLGLASVDRTLEGMKRIRAAVDETGAFVTALGRRSAEIEKILDLIEEVTDQTELLSLNASILAAQAGEHGRGFAVVAGEIKNLADRARSSTGEVTEFVRTVQRDVANVTRALGNGLEAAQQGMVVAGDAGAALRQVLASSTRSTSMAQSIERSTADQAAAAGRALRAMGTVRSMITQIAAATAEQSHSASLISEEAERIAGASQEVSRETQEQAATSRLVSRSVENIFERVQQISRSLSEHEEGSKLILSSIGKVKDIPARNRVLAASISAALRGLLEEAEQLEVEMSRFQLGERLEVLGPPPGGVQALAAQEGVAT